MKMVIIGASSQAGVEAIVWALSTTDFDLNLFLRNNRNIGAYLLPDREASDIIEASAINYTVLRPAWLTNTKKVDYEITLRDEPFKGTEISHRSVAEVALENAKNPALYSRENIGINKPGTDGDNPAFI